MKTVHSQSMNMIEIKGIVKDGVNLLDASEFITPNAVYHINETFDLEGNTIHLPENCTLSFNGGSLKNGTLVGNNTFIETANGGIFENVRAEGLFENDYANVKWYNNVIGNGTNNDQPGIQLALNSSFKSIYFPDGTFNIASTSLKITTSKKTLFGNGNNRSVLKCASAEFIFEIQTKLNNIDITGLSFNSTASSTVVKYAVYVRTGCSDISIKDCVFDGFTTGINFEYNIQNVIVSECIFRNMLYVPRVGAGGYGVVFERRATYTGTTNYIVEKCTFEKTVYRHCIYTQLSSGKICNNNFHGDINNNATKYEARLHAKGAKDLIIENNFFDGGIYAIHIYNTEDNDLKGTENLIITNNIFKNYQQLLYGHGVVRLEYIREGIVSNNVFTNNKGVAINVYSEVTNTIISNNNISTLNNTANTFGSHGIEFLEGSGDKSKRIVVKDNMIKIDPAATTSSGIRFQITKDYSDIYIKSNVVITGYNAVSVYSNPTTVKIIKFVIQDNIGKDLRAGVVQITSQTDNVINTGNISR